MTQMSTQRRLDPADMSMGELVSSLSEQTSRLVRDEIRLATKELQAKGKHAGLGVGMFGGAGVVALYGVGALVTAAIGGLALAMDVWAAALIVGLVLFAVAGVLALTGKKQVAQAVPAAPEQAMAGLKADIETVKENAHR
jgi:MFS family permease